MDILENFKYPKISKLISVEFLSDLKTNQNQHESENVGIGMNKY